MAVTLLMNVGYIHNFLCASSQKKIYALLTWRKQDGREATRWTTTIKWFDSWQGQEIYLLQNIQTGYGTYTAYHSTSNGGKACP
jgi:hypothetical protein